MELRDLAGRLRGIFYRPTMSRRSATIFLAMSLILIVAIIMRIYPAQYGWFLNEFDPYFDYYASYHVVVLAQQHGLLYALFNDPANCPASLLTSCHTQQGYFNWHDVQMWYPYGRNVAATSQVGLQLTGAISYLIVNSIFGIQVSYYDFLVFFPVLLGSITIVPLYYLVKKITNSAGGIFAALIFAVSPPILERGNLGWFKSEPLSLFASIIGAYFFLSMFSSKTTLRGVLIRGFLAGLMFGYSIIDWGGGDEFVLIFGLVFLIAPFVKSVDLQKTVQGGSILVGTLLLFAAVTPRPGPGIITDLVGLPLIASWVFAFLAYFVKKYGDPASYTKNLVKILLIFVFGGLIFVSFGAIGGISGRYLTVLYSQFRTGDPLVQSVAEQAVPTGSQFFSDYAVVILLSGFGAYIAFRKRSIEGVFALVLALTGVYIASSFSRLMVYSTLALGILGAIGLIELSESILRPTVSTVSRKKSRIYESRSEVKVLFAVLMVVLIAVPIFIPANTSNGYKLSHSGWIASANVPVSLANGGTAFSTSSTDWQQALNWMRTLGSSTTIVSWWDYGYWTAVMGNVTSLADNATINETQISYIGQALVDTPHQSLQVLKNNLHSPQYILIFIAGYAFSPQSQQGQTAQLYYMLTVPTPYPQPAGGDESKKQWFMRIGNTTCGCIQETNGPRALMEPDDFTPTPYFWSSSTLGQLIPFQSQSLYYNPVSSQTANGYNQTVSTTSGASGISNGYTEVYSYLMKFPASSTKAPFQLAFESSSLPGVKGLYSAVLVYKINYNATV
ncbi:MAG: glycosyltransferase family 39 protein [Thaumarchaeota archaeon]|nr:glycosyltransferase family 39 protein [Nitrososphaerota archaeon]